MLFLNTTGGNLDFYRCVLPDLPEWLRNNFVSKDVDLVVQNLDNILIDTNSETSNYVHTYNQLVTNNTSPPGRDSPGSHFRDQASFAAAVNAGLNGYLQSIISLNTFANKISLANPIWSYFELKLL